MVHGLPPNLQNYLCSLRCFVLSVTSLPEFILNPQKCRLTVKVMWSLDFPLESLLTTSSKLEVESVSTSGLEFLYFVSRVCFPKKYSLLFEVLECRLQRLAPDDEGRSSWYFWMTFEEKKTTKRKFHIITIRYPHTFDMILNLT